MPENITVTGVEAWAHGPPGVGLDENPKVTIVERRMLNEFKEDPQALVEWPLPPQQLAEPPTTHARRNGICYDVDYYRDDIVKGNGVNRWQKYVDYSIEGVWLETYLDWLRSLLEPGSTLGVGGVFPTDGIVPLRAMIPFPAGDDSIANRDLGLDIKTTELTSGWVRVDVKFADDGTKFIQFGTPYPVESNFHECGTQDPSTDTPFTKVNITVRVIDIDTGYNLGGNSAAMGGGGGKLTFSGDGIDPITVDVSRATGPTDDTAGNGIFVDVGATLKIVHTPPPGYKAVKNSLNLLPPGQLIVPVKGDALYIFYDQKIGNSPG